MVYAVIDTNIFVSAFITKNATASTRRVINSLFAGKIKPLYNDEIIEEYSEVLHRSKFHLADKDIQRNDGDIGLWRIRWQYQQITQCAIHLVCSPLKQQFQQATCIEQASLLHRASSKHPASCPCGSSRTKNRSSAAWRRPLMVRQPYSEAVWAPFLSPTRGTEGVVKTIEEDRDER